MFSAENNLFYNILLLLDISIRILGYLFPKLEYKHLQRSRLFFKNLVDDKLQVM